jgi:hypothetical protein
MNKILLCEYMSKCGFEPHITLYNMTLLPNHIITSIKKLKEIANDNHYLTIISENNDGMMDTILFNNTHLKYYDYKDDIQKIEKLGDLKDYEYYDIWNGNKSRKYVEKYITTSKNIRCDRGNVRTFFEKYMNSHKDTDVLAIIYK